MRYASDVKLGDVMHEVSAGTIRAEDTKIHLHWCGPVRSRQKGLYSQVAVAGNTSTPSVPQHVT